MIKAVLQFSREKIKLSRSDGNFSKYSENISSDSEQSSVYVVGFIAAFGQPRRTHRRVPSFHSLLRLYDLDFKRKRKNVFPLLDVVI